MPSDLRSIWPTLTPKERDARVAKALGWVVVSWAESVHGARKCYQCLQPGGRDLYAGEAIVPWADFNPEIVRGEAPYSTSWEHAGVLLDKLREEGWLYQVGGVFAGHSIVLWIDRGEPAERINAWGSTAPEAIALAFCLSREVERG